MPKTDRLIIHEISQADAQQFLASVRDGDEMTDYLNALPGDIVQRLGRVRQEPKSSLESLTITTCLICPN